MLYTGTLVFVSVALAAAGHTLFPTVAAPASSSQPKVTAFVNVAVVPMDTERVLSNQTVIIEGGSITALGPSEKIKVPAAAVRIDGRGKYLIPGLADMHTHMLYQARDSAQVEQRLFTWLADGVTTIRNVDYLPLTRMTLDTKLALGFRDRAARGTLRSPRIYTSGVWAPPQYVETVKDAAAPRLDSMAAYVAAYKAAGYDFLKVHQEPAAVVESLVVIAPRVGIPLLGHVRKSMGIERVLASGRYASIEHLRGYVSTPLSSDSAATFDAARVEKLVVATTRSGVWNCPTLALDEKRPEWDIAVRRRLVKAMQDAGGRLLLGTDTPLAGPVQAELAALTRAGLTPYQALLTGTRNVAEYFGTLAETGTVAVGKRADVVLLNGNPLENITNTVRPAGVMIGGQWLAREELDRGLVGNAP